jgi:hypothetical protein
MLETIVPDAQTYFSFHGSGSADMNLKGLSHEIDLENVDESC